MIEQHEEGARPQGAAKEEAVLPLWQSSGLTYQVQTCCPKVRRDSRLRRAARQSPQSRSDKSIAMGQAQGLAGKSRLWARVRISAGQSLNEAPKQRAHGSLTSQQGYKAAL